MAINSLQQITDSDIRLIRNFLVVVEHKGLSEASYVLNTHLSTLSNSISKLEGRLGFVLCQRGNKGFKLTEKGANFYKASVKLIESIEDYREHVNQIISSTSGSLRIGVLASAGCSDPFGLDDVLRRFKAGCGEVKIKLSYNSNINLITELLNNKLDFIFFSSLSNHKGVEAVHLSDRTSYLYCHKSHPLFTQRNVVPDDVSRYETVRLLYGSNEDYKTVNPHVTWNFTASCNTLSGCLSLMNTGRFLGVMPACEMQELVTTGEYRAISQTRFKSLPLYNCLGFLKGSEFNDTQKMFCDTVKQGINTKNLVA